MIITKGLSGFGDISDALKAIMSALPEIKVHHGESGILHHENADAGAHQLAEFTERLAAKSDSTSTPFLPRVQSIPKLGPCESLLFDNELHSQSQDSGFESQEIHTTLLDTDASIISLQQDNKSKRSTKDVESTVISKIKHFIDELNRKCPREKWIGRRIGEEYVDIISELSHQNLPCVSQILSFLTDRDLKSCIHVSSAWEKACYEDERTKQRFAAMRRLSLQIGKENSSPKDSPSPSTHTSSTNPLGCVQNTHHTPSPSSDSNTYFDRFVKEGQKLRQGERLEKCPRCKAPARIDEAETQGLCTKTDCLYTFCIICKSEFHGARECSPRPEKKAKSYIITSKKAKRRLRRLL